MWARKKNLRFQKSFLCAFLSAGVDIDSVATSVRVSPCYLDWSGVGTGDHDRTRVRYPRERHFLLVDYYVGGKADGHESWPSLRVSWRGWYV